MSSSMLRPSAPQRRATVKNSGVMLLAVSSLRMVSVERPALRARASRAKPAVSRRRRSSAPSSAAEARMDAATLVLGIQ